MSEAAVRLALPDWAAGPLDPPPPGAGDRERMAFAVALARRNVEEGTGGPFGAAVWSGDELLAVGVNVVLAQGASIAHAEVMALAGAQQRLGRPRLAEGPAGPGRPRVALVTSAQPCVMCFGAVLWAGVDELVIGARGEDVESLAGFDEGPLPADWPAELAARGIAVRRDVEREAARAVLAAYAARGGPRY
jgi:tRNA(Arg) A34 adenosine deaminase TadA